MGGENFVETCPDGVGSGAGGEIFATSTATLQRKGDHLLSVMASAQGTSQDFQVPGKKRLSEFFSTRVDAGGARDRV